MFPATVLVAVLVGFHVSTVLLAPVLRHWWLCYYRNGAIGKFIPLYYGSSFSYIAAMLAITNATMNQVAPDELIRTAQAGIVVTGHHQCVV